MNYVSFVSMNYACMVGWHYCNMYGWMHVCRTCYVWLMELCMYDEIICVGYLICLLWTCHVKNIYVSSICCENGWVYEKTEAMQALCRLPLTATGSLPSAADGKEATWHPAVLPGSWPIWSVCLQWQTAKSKRVCRQRRTAKACHVVTCRWHHTADGKDTRKFAVSGGRQRH